MSRIIAIEGAPTLIESQPKNRDTNRIAPDVDEPPRLLFNPTLARELQEISRRHNLPIVLPMQGTPHDAQRDADHTMDAIRYVSQTAIPEVVGIDLERALGLFRENVERYISQQRTSIVGHEAAHQITVEKKPKFVKPFPHYRKLDLEGAPTFARINDEDAYQCGSSALHKVDYLNGPVFYSEATAFLWKPKYAIVVRRITL